MKPLLTLLLSAAAFGQPRSEHLMTLDLQNVVFYYDVGEPARVATSPTPIPLSATYIYPFKPYVILADLVAVNGKPVKGTMVGRGVGLNTSTAVTPVAGRTIADFPRNQIFDFQVEVLQPDGTQVGTLAAVALGAGGSVPGGPPPFAAGNFTIIGGSGAYLGARGQAATARANLRITSNLEDPAYRRVNGGGTWQIAVHLIDVIRPEIVNIFRADFTRVTPERPAARGEVLVLQVKGLGPVRPALAPGATFGDSIPAMCAAPVEVRAGDEPLEVINCLGWPGTRDTYRVDVRLPSGLAAGVADLRIAPAHLAEGSAAIPVR